MKRIVKISVFALICGLVFTLIGCETNDNLEIEDSEDSGKVTVSLLESDDYVVFEKTVILYETENYLIKTPLYHFLGSMHNLFGINYDNFLSTLKKIVSDGRTNNLLYSSEYFDTNQVDYVMANFLENGLCYFYDKKSESKVEQVEFEYCINTVSQAGWRKFYINSVLFLETTDSFIGYKDKNEVGEKITVSLMERDDYSVFEKMVVLYENESYLIKAPLSHFLSEMDKNYLHKYDEHISSLEKVISDGQKSNLLLSSSYFDKHRIDYVLAHFLEYGQCYIYDKKDKKTVKQITVEYWGDSSAPLAGAGGRRFYINNVLFRETTDWIS